ncbi:acyl transferase [Pontibacter sp. G13]|uniref:LuxE/PaaK family acyltransferase n=1 Tax=Pontibacter sp. G13 TaxID=3074898 RepID=UPI00288926DD|nr:acyl transferase [Pontibacter sp. G13]WNJ20864.1 acyl transferase [Pontibacter sp. G13]
MAFDPDSFFQRIFAPEADFEALADELWAHQSQTVPQIRQFCEVLGTDARQSMPISFFKHFELKDGHWEPEAIFGSSGTTGQTPSRHFVKDLESYRINARRGFEAFFPAGDYQILALLPSYLERGNSSLVRMVQNWIEDFGLPGSGFFLDDFNALRTQIDQARESGTPLILIGVAFALLDFVESHGVQLPPDAIVLETGGMKGRKKELVREELHEILKAGFGVSQIHSEYGMTELLSQAYTGSHGRFQCPPSMRVFMSDIHLNRLIQPIGVTGRLHIIDLANIHSCAFIATDDLGRMHADGSFEVLGRLDTAEMRGCNLMYVG